MSESLAGMSARTAQRFASWQALFMLSALGLALASGRVLPLAAAGVFSLACFVWLARAAFTGTGRFGAANLVTSLRVLLSLALGYAFDQRASFASAACALSIFALDAVDGWLARRSGASTPFGARFDMEADACFMLLLSAGLYVCDRAGPWVLLSGALRYVYVLALAISGRSAAEAPRSWFARNSFGLAVTSCVLALWPAARFGRALCAIATLLLVQSFAGSFYVSFRARALD